MARCHCGFTDAESEKDYVSHLHCIRCDGAIVQQAERELIDYKGYEIGITFWKFQIKPWDKMVLVCQKCKSGLLKWLKLQEELIP